MVVLQAIIDGLPDFCARVIAAAIAFWSWPSINSDAQPADLNRFNQDGADLFPAKEALDTILNALPCRTGVPPVFLDFFQRIVGCLLSQAGGLSSFWKGDEMRELTKLRTERAAKVFAMRRVERPIAKTMISALERDNAAFARGQRGGLERGFDCFKAGVAKNCFPASHRREEADRSFASWIPPPHVGGYRPALECDPAQFPRQLRFQGVRMHVAHRVQQFVHLALPGLYHAWIRMAGRRDAKGRCQIEILFTFGIPDMRVARPVPHHRPGTVRFDERDVARFVKAQEIENVLSPCFQSGGCRNTRSQTPNTKETPNPKHQSSVRRVVARLVFSA